MSNIKFPNADEHQNKILNMIAEQEQKKLKAEQDTFDKEKDKTEFLYLWKHFKLRLNKYLDEFVDETYNDGRHSLEVTLTVKKDDSDDNVVENFVYNKRLNLKKILEI